MLGRRRTWILLIVAALPLLLAACGGTTPAQPAATTEVPQTLTKNADGYVDITVQQLTTMLEDKDFTLVNTHIPYSGELPQTDLFIPYNEIADQVNKLPADKDALIVVYCRSGSMSTAAAKTLIGLGYTNIMEVDGGFNAWKTAGYELINKQ